MPDNNQQDPYIGHVVKIVDRRTFQIEKDINESELYYLLYKKNSMFLVVGIREKNCYYAFYNTKRNFYILKPLEKDVDNKNINKNLCWNSELYVNSAWNQVFQIVD